MFNVMIADDEAVTRKYLLNFVNWQSLDCSVLFEANNGIEAIEYVQKNSNIDIIIADIKMPGIDGIKLSQYIYENHPNIKTIILTAYADFSYAQSAIKYGVIDFIIKTNPDEKLKEAVSKAKELIRSQKETDDKLKLLENKIIRNLSEISEKLLKDIINGMVPDTKIIESRIDELNINLSNYFIVVFEIRESSVNYRKSDMDEYNEFIYAIRNFLSLAFKDYPQYTVIMDKNILLTIVSFQNGAASDCTQSLLFTCNEILTMVDTFMKFNLSIGISGLHRSVHDLSKAYCEALESIFDSFYNGNTISVYTPKSCVQTDNNPSQVYKLMDEIFNCIQQGDAQNASDNLMMLMDEYKNNQAPIEQVRVSCIIICSSCFRLLINNCLNLPICLESETAIYRQIQDSKYIQSLSNIVFKVVNSICQVFPLNETNINYLVREVNKFITEKYNENINLQVIADHLHINYSYLSRLYKKETGVSAIDILNKFRIEKAKQLLKDPANKIFNVAQEVGIEDPAYFTHVFIRYAGVSPKEYRSKISSGKE